jgi:hypothetical protein
MRICDLHTGLGQLAQALADLEERWEQSAVHWKDDVRREFEETHLQPIPTCLQRMSAAVQRLSEVIEKAQRDCEDRPTDE